jgi:hypothetical protein
MTRDMNVRLTPEGLQPDERDEECMILTDPRWWLEHQARRRRARRAAVGVALILTLATLSGVLLGVVIARGAAPAPARKTPSLAALVSAEPRSTAAALPTPSSASAESAGSALALPARVAGAAPQTSSWMGR